LTALRSAKGDEESNFSDAGRQIDSSDMHPPNDPRPIVSRSESDSKTREHRLEQDRKHCSPSERTDFGMQIDFSDEQLAKASASI
jgi:hypothetical protein